MKINGQKSPHLLSNNNSSMVVRYPNYRHYSQYQKMSNSIQKANNSQKPLDPPQQLAEEKPPDYTWPLFKLATDFSQKKFWDKRTKLDMERIWFNTDETIFTGIMLRIGKKKRTPKGYFFRLLQNGMLLQFKKVESDSLPKGYIKLGMNMRVSIIEQKTKRNNRVPVILMERCKGVAITIYDHRVDKTLEFFNIIKLFCLIRGFSYCYQQQDSLGKGSFATVYKVKNLISGETFAAKTYFQETYDNNQHKDKFYVKQRKILITILNQQMVHNEVIALRTIRHPGIVKLYEIIQEKDKLVLIMEFVAGGDLYQMIKKKKKITERNSAILMKGVVEALEEMHKQNYVHRDLKLENIMLDAKESFNIKLVDFGFSEKINPTQLVSKAGTPGFIPPEIFKSQPYTEFGDIFSLGVIFYSIISGDSPFKAKNYQQIIEANRNCNIDFNKSIWLEVSQDCRNLIKRMCEPKPENRLKCSEILEHGWIQSLMKAPSETVSQSIIFQNQLPHEEPKRAMSKKSSRSSRDKDNDQSQEFQGEFSYHELKSFYRKNSLKTIHSQQSNNNVQKQQQQQMRKSFQLDNQTPPIMEQKKCQSMKISMKSSVKFKQIDDEEVNEIKNSQYLGQNKNESFGDNNTSSNCYIEYLIKRIENESIYIPDDFDAIHLGNLLFLKISDQLFNHRKQPEIKKKVKQKPGSPQTQSHSEFNLKQYFGN